MYWLRVSAASTAPNSRKTLAFMSVVHADFG